MRALVASESLRRIVQLLERNFSYVRRLRACSGGIRAPVRRQSTRAVSLGQREEISRAVVAGQPIHSIGIILGRTHLTVSREVRRNEGQQGYDFARSW